MRFSRVVRLWIVICCALGFGQIRISAADREVFLHEGGENDGALIHDYENRWVEVVNSRERFAFEELGRTDDSIELLDRGRDVGLKVHADHGEIRLPGSTIWRPWLPGKWIARDELPARMRVVPTDDKIRLVYFVASDRDPTANYERKIRVVMEVVNDLYLSALQGRGYPFTGLNLEKNAEGEPVVNLVRAKQDAGYYNNGPTYDQVMHFRRIANEIPGEVGYLSRHMLVVFAETYDPGPASIEWDGSVGRGAHISTDGGLAVISAWILRDEFCATSYHEQKKLLLDTTPIIGRTALGTRRPDSPGFEFIEDGFGAVAHELGHALGLPHDKRQPNNVMGLGFRSLQRNYLASTPKGKRIQFSPENSRPLRVSRYLFPDNDRTDNTPPNAEMLSTLVKGEKPTVVISLKASDDRGLRAVLFYNPQHDSVINGAELQGKTQNLKLTLPISKGQSNEYSLVALVTDAGGNTTSVNAAISIP